MAGIFKKPNLAGIDALLAPGNEFLDDLERSVFESSLSWSRSHLLGETRMPAGGGEPLSLARFSDHDHCIPVELMDEFGSLGYLGLTVPEDLGGVGLSQLGLCCAIEAVSYGCPSLGVTASVQNSLVASVLMNFGEGKFDDLLRHLAAGRGLGAYLLSETEAGSDPASMRCHAKLDGDSYIINGSKMWITSGRETVDGIGGSPDRKGVGILFVTTDPTLRKNDFDRRHKAIIALVVDFREISGVTVTEVGEKLGLRGSSTVEVSFENARIPATNLLVGAGNGEGIKIAYQTLDGGRIGIASQASGMLLRAIELALAHTKARVQGGRRIAESELVQGQFGEIAQSYLAARALIHQAARLNDKKSEDVNLAASAAKYAASEAAMQGIRQCLLLHGGMGFVEGDIAMLYRTAPILGIYEGANNVQRLVLGRRLVGSFED